MVYQEEGEEGRGKEGKEQVNNQLPMYIHSRN